MWRVSVRSGLKRRKQGTGSYFLWLCGVMSIKVMSFSISQTEGKPKRIVGCYGGFAYPVFSAVAVKSQSVE